MAYASSCLLLLMEVTQPGCGWTRHSMGRNKQFRLCATSSDSYKPHPVLMICSDYLQAQQPLHKCLH